MAVGQPTTKQDLDTWAGAITRDLEQALGQRVVEMQAYLTATPDQNLEDMGYSSEDVAILKSAFGQLSLLNSIYTGAADLPVPQDFRTFAKLLHPPVF